jgi:HK97 family phage portal protein
MAWPNFLSRRDLPSQPALPARRNPEIEPDDFSAIYALQARIADHFKKSMSYANYVAWDNVDDQGGYFGTEFEIRSNAGRIKSLYAREPWVWASATLVARSLCVLPYKAYVPGTDQEIVNHPVTMVMRQGTPTLSPIATRWLQMLDVMLGGNSILILEPDMKTVAGIAPIELVNFQYSKDSSQIEYVDVYAYGGDQKAARFPYSQCVHTKYPNPYNPFYGLSPFIAAARPLLSDRYASEFDMAFYLRGGTASGVIETTEEISKSRFQRLMRTFEASFTGRSNWWRTLFLPKGTAWKSAQLTPAEAQHLDKLKDNRKVILAVLGIPPSMVGLIEDVNRATAEQQERALWANLLTPMAIFNADGWNASSLVRDTYKGKVEVKPDFSAVEAVEGFVAARRERSEAMSPYFFIDEIREKVWKAEPLPDGLGQRLVAEVKPAMPTLALAAGGISTRMAAIPDGMSVQALYFLKAQFGKAEDAQQWAREHGFATAPVHEMADEWMIEQEGLDLYERETMKRVTLEDGVNANIGARNRVDDKAAKAAIFKRVKETAIASQNRVETKLAKDFEAALAKYVEALVLAAKTALERKANVQAHLDGKASERREIWAENVIPVLERALDRGFSVGLSQVRLFDKVQIKEVREGFPALNETDRQAVDVLRERTRSGRREVLAKRGLDRFVGLDRRQTEQVMQIIEDGENDGKTFEQIAQTIRRDFGEAYGNQARTIVRTEILSAVSEGLAWNHDVLGQVFSEVQKQWIHQGDAGLNDDAREEHAALEDDLKSGDDAWSVIDSKTGEAYTLRYPRDPSAPASGVINCRCSMVTVIPDSATSNADAILEG